MTIRMYGAAIRDAITRKDLNEMKQVLAQAKQLRKEQGNLDQAILRLQTAIGKLAKKTPRKTARKAPKKS